MRCSNCATTMDSVDPCNSHTGYTNYTSTVYCCPNCELRLWLIMEPSVSATQAPTDAVNSQRNKKELWF